MEWKQNDPLVPPVIVMGFQNVKLNQEDMLNFWLQPKLGIYNVIAIHDFLWRKFVI
jgi:hypothetical protein